MNYGSETNRTGRNDSDSRRTTGKNYIRKSIRWDNSIHCNNLDN